MERPPFKEWIKENYNDGFSYVPSILWWPNIEVIIMIFFAPALMFHCAAVVAKAVKVYSIPDPPKGEINGVPREWLDPQDLPKEEVRERVADGGAVFIIICMGIFIAHECARLFVFMRKHAEALWISNEEVRVRAQMDDMILDLLCAVGLVRPGLRFRGSLATDENSKDMAEPQRTSRALSAPYVFKFWERRAGDAYATLSTSWLYHARGKYGCFYQMVKFLTQVAFGVVVGVSTQSGGYKGIAIVPIALLILLQLGLGYYCCKHNPSSDRLEGLVSGVEAILSAVSLTLRWQAALMYEALDEEQGLKVFSHLMIASNVTLFVALLLPLALPAYNVLASFDRKRRIRAARSAKRKRRAAALRAIADEWAATHPPPTDEELAAAVRITSVARGRVTRKKVQVDKVKRQKKQREKDKKKIAAAVAVQARARGNLAREQADHLRELREQGLLEAEQGEAAQLIQAACRGQSTRLGLKLHKKCTVRAQAVYRGEQCRKLFEVEKPERVARRNRLREQKLRERMAANTIARRALRYVYRCRERVIRQREERENSAAFRIGACWRGHLARVRFRLEVERLARREAARELKEKLDAMDAATAALDAKRFEAAARRREKHEQQVNAAVRITAIARGKIARKMDLAEYAMQQRSKQSTSDGAQPRGVSFAD